MNRTSPPDRATRRRILPSPVILLVALALQAGSGWDTAWAETGYIQISGRRVNIRAAPRTSSQVITRASSGDVFQVEGEEGRWYIIHMFSGDSRYVHKSVAKEVRYSPQVPEDASVRQQIFHAWLDAEAKVKSEADERYPPDKDLGKNIEYGRLLTDRYKLEVVHEFEIQPPVYRRIHIEGFQKGW